MKQTPTVSVPKVPPPEGRVRAVIVFDHDLLFTPTLPNLLWGTVVFYSFFLITSRPNGKIPRSKASDL